MCHRWSYNFRWKLIMTHDIEFHSVFVFENSGDWLSIVSNNLPPNHFNSISTNHGGIRVLEYLISNWHKQTEQKLEM